MNNLLLLIRLHRMLKKSSFYAVLFSGLKPLILKRPCPELFYEIAKYLNTRITHYHSPEVYIKRLRRKK